MERGCESAIKSHARGGGHKTNLTNLENSKKGLSPLFFKKVPTTTLSHTERSPASAAPGNSAAASSSQPTAIDQLVAQQTSVTRAEIIWVLRVVKNHDSFRSCLELGEDLQAMIPNNDIVSKFKLSKTKCSYYVTHGIAPWVRGNLQTEVSASPFFSVSFDESLNIVMQENQMDIQIRFWSEKQNKAITRYWGSQFQLRSDADTLTDSLMKGLAVLPVKKQHQLAMDGPNTNWKILRLITEMRDKEEHPPLENIGSCGLHVVSGALHTGVVAGSWPVEKILRAMYKFLNKSPARRAEYIHLSSSGLYPAKFCSTRWVENECCKSSHRNMGRLCKTN